MGATLYHLRDSHYNEKARWALDHKRFPHTRRAALAGFHPLVALLATRRQYTLPALVLDGRNVGDSTAIIAELERRVPEPPLYPADPAVRERALALAARFDGELAEQSRRVVLFHTLRDASAVDAMTNRYVGPAVSTALPALLPGLRRALFGRYGVSEASAADARERTFAALDDLEAEIGPSGYLAGQEFTVADLTGAAMLGPLLRPPEYPYPAFALPAALEEFKRELAARPAAAWAREIYARHRSPTR